MKGRHSKAKSTRKSPYRRKTFKKYTKKSPKKFISKSKKPLGVTRKAVKAGTSHWKAFGKGPHDHKHASLIKKLETLLPVSIYFQNIPLRVVGSQGLQTYALCGRIYTPEDMISIATNATGTGLLGAKLFLKDYRQICMFTNNSNMNVFLDVYTAVCRDDIYADNIKYYNPTVALANDTVAVNSTTYGSTPFDSQYLTSNFRITRVAHFVLGEGESAEHITTGRVNYLFNQTRITDQGTDTTGVSQDKGGWKGLTTYTFLCQRTAPYDEGSATVTVGAAIVDIVTSTRYCSSTISTAGQTYSSGGTIVTTGTLSVMQPATGSLAAPVS